MKRQSLAIESLQYTRSSVHIAFLGVPDVPEYGEALRRMAAKAGVLDRITWLGGVSESEKIELYADCKAVVFPPIDEDYGYISLEAMLAKKAIITCDDSGGPLEFVRDGVTGLIVEPEPQALAAALDRIWGSQSLASRFGQNAYDHYLEMEIGWDRVLQCLLN
jgi:glycosyltransferase involved in cell wall biosynthesis